MPRAESAGKQLAAQLKILGELAVPLRAPIMEYAGSLRTPCRPTGSAISNERAIAPEELPGGPPQQMVWTVMPSPWYLIPKDFRKSSRVAEHEDPRTGGTITSTIQMCAFKGCKYESSQEVQVAGHFRRCHMAGGSCALVCVWCATVYEYNTRYLVYHTRRCLANLWVRCCEKERHMARMRE